VQELPDIAFSSEHTAFRRIDVFLPSPRHANARCIVCIHGGGWTGGTRTGWHSVARYFCERGYVTASADYRLAPQWAHPAQLEDVGLAMGWLRAHADEYGFARDMLAVLGSSAGGHLAALLATPGRGRRSAAELQLPRPDAVPDAVVCYCPVLDVAEFAGGCPDLVEALLGRRAEDVPELCSEASPLARVTGEEPPFLLLHGDADDVVPPRQSIEMGRLLRAKGGRADVVILPGVGHGFGYGVDTPAQRESLAHISGFLDEVFGLAG